MDTKGRESPKPTFQEKTEFGSSNLFSPCYLL